MFFQGYAVEGGEAGSLLKADVGCPPWVGPQSLPFLGQDERSLGVMESLPE